MRLATLVLAILLLCAPVAVAAGTTTTPAPLVSSVPFLTDTHTSTTATVTRGLPASPTTTTASAAPNGDLPYTGLNLLPETIVAVALILGGILLRLFPGLHRGWRSRW
jgi:hypothetical protein